MVSIRAVGWEGPGNDETQLKGVFPHYLADVILDGWGGVGLKAMLLKCRRTVAEDNEHIKYLHDSVYQKVKGLS